MNRRLYRSRENRMIAGVCGGIAEYFNLDPTMIRLAAAILLVVTNVPIFIAYIICAIVIPEGKNDMYEYDNYPDYSQDKDYSNQDNEESNYSYYEGTYEGNQKKKNNQRIIGIGMIIIGGIMLFDMHYVWIDTSTFWSIAIIGCGGLMLYNSRRREQQ